MLVTVAHGSLLEQLFNTWEAAEGTVYQPCFLVAAGQMLAHAASSLLLFHACVMQRFMVNWGLQGLGL